MPTTSVESYSYTDEYSTGERVEHQITKTTHLGRFTQARRCAALYAGSVCELQGELLQITIPRKRYLHGENLLSEPPQRMLQQAGVLVNSERRYPDKTVFLVSGEYKVTKITVQ